MGYFQTKNERTVVNIVKLIIEWTRIRGTEKVTPQQLRCAWYNCNWCPASVAAVLHATGYIVPLYT